MCGLYGYRGKADKRALAETMISMEGRGKDAHGWGYMGTDGKLRRRTRLGHASAAKVMPPVDAAALIAHTRLATSGTRKVEGAHPYVLHVGDQKWLGAHNGSCSGFEPLLKWARQRKGTTGEEDRHAAESESRRWLREVGCAPQTDVDSEIVLLTAVLGLVNAEYDSWLPNTEWNGALTLISPQGVVYVLRKPSGDLYMSPDGNFWRSSWHGTYAPMQVPSHTRPRPIADLAAEALAAATKRSAEIATKNPAPPPPVTKEPAAAVAEDTLPLIQIARAIGE